MAIKVTHVNGTEKTYSNAARMEVDGHGDYVFFDVDNNVVGGRRRNTVEEYEVINDGAS